MNSKPLKNIAYPLWSNEAAQPTWFFFRKNQGLIGVTPGKMARICFIVAFLTIISIIPVNGSAKTKYQPSHELATNFGPGLSGQIIQYFPKVLFAAECDALLFEVNKFASIPAAVLFIEQSAGQNKQESTPLNFWVVNVVFLSMAFIIFYGLGYFLRHSISVRRRRVMQRWETEQSTAWDQQSGSGTKTQPVIQKTTSVLETTVPIKEAPRQVALPVREKNQLPIKEVIVKTKPLIAEQPVEAAKPKLKPGDVLYFPKPNNGGNFLQADGRAAFTNGASVYKFKMVSPYEAKFEFCQHPSSINKALADKAGLILSVADEANEYNANASQLVTHKYGVASFDGTIWTVKTKLKIRYV